MAEKPRPIEEDDEEATSEGTPSSGPLGQLVDNDMIGPAGTVDSAETAAKDYASGTTEHDDDREE